MSDGEQDTSFAEFEQSVNAPPVDPPAPPPAEDAPEDEGEQTPPAEGEDAPPADDKPTPKPRETQQEAIDRITAKRRDEERRANQAERDAKYWRDVAEGRTAHPAQRQESKAEEPKAPNPDDYDLGRSDERYIEAVIDFRVQQGLDKVESRMAQGASVQAAERAWEAKQDAARSEIADYDEKVISGAHNWPCSEVAAEAIRTSDAGAKIAYHLASNPDEARRINGLSPFAQVLEIGKITASLDGDRPAPAKTTNAPKPPSGQARGAGGHFAPNAATTDFAEFEAMANRRAN